MHAGCAKRTMTRCFRSRLTVWLKTVARAQRFPSCFDLSPRQFIGIITLISITLFSPNSRAETFNCHLSLYIINHIWQWRFIGVHGLLVWRVYAQWLWWKWNFAFIRFALRYHSPKRKVEVVGFCFALLYLFSTFTTFIAAWAAACCDCRARAYCHLSGHGDKGNAIIPCCCRHYAHGTSILFTSRVQVS